MEEKYHIRKIGIISNQQTLLIEFMDNHSQQIYCKRIRIKHIETMDVQEVCRRIFTKFNYLLDEASTDAQQMVKLAVEKLVTTNSPSKPGPTPQTFSFAEEPPIESNKEPPSLHKQLPTEILHIDLNKVSDDVNRKAKEMMNVVFESKRLKPGDPDYVWDKQMDFEPPSEDNEWDEDDE